MTVSFHTTHKLHRRSKDHRCNRRWFVFLDISSWFQRRILFSSKSVVIVGIKFDKPSAAIFRRTTLTAEQSKFMPKSVQRRAVSSSLPMGNEQDLLPFFCKSFCSTLHEISWELGTYLFDRLFHLFIFLHFHREGVDAQRAGVTGSIEVQAPVVCLYAWSDNEHCHEAHLHALYRCRHVWASVELKLLYRRNEKRLC